MPRSAVVAIAALTGVLTLLSGCVAQRDGNASTGSQVPSSQASLGRPANLDLSGVDPCALLTKAQRSRMHIGKVVSAKSDSALNARQCAFRVWDVKSLNIVTDPDHSIGMWQSKAVPKKPTTISGFPAILLDPSKRLCRVVVDVHAGQQLEVKSPEGNDEKQGRNVCSSVRQWTKAALQTLRTLQ